MSGTPRLVTNLPIWTKCPYRIPGGLEVRRGAFGDEPEVIVVWSPKGQRHIDFVADAFDEDAFKIACNLLIGRKAA